MQGHARRQRVTSRPALAGHGAKAIRDAITRTITGLLKQLRQSLIWHQGVRMAQHA
jgi:IS30 family transposase